MCVCCRSSEEFDAVVAAILSSSDDSSMQRGLTQLALCLDHYWSDAYGDKILASSGMCPGDHFIQYTAT